MSLLRRIATVGSGAAGAQLLAVASTPVLTRLYAPEAHAAWAVFLGVSAIFAGLSTFRYELAVVLPADRRPAAALVLAGLCAAAIVSVVSLLALGWAPAVFETGEERMLKEWLLWVPLMVLATAAYQLVVAWYTREASFRSYAVAQLALPLTIFLFQVALAWAGRRDGWGLIAGTISGQAVVALALVAHVAGRERTLFKTLRWREIRAAATAFRKYPLYMTPYTAVGLTRERLVYFLLGRLGSAGAAGYYLLVARLVNMPNSLVSSVLRPVFFQHAAHQPIPRLEEPVLQLVRALGVLGALVYAPIVVHAPWLLSIAFGADWAPAAPYLALLALPAIPLMMGNWLDRMFDVLGRQRLALGLELTFSLTAMAGLVGGYALWRDLLWAVGVQSGLLAVYYVVWLVMLFRLAGFRVAGLVSVFGQVFLCGLGALGSAAALARWLEPPAALLGSVTLSLLIGAWLGLHSWRRMRKFLSGPPDSP